MPWTTKNCLTPYVIAMAPRPPMPLQRIGPAMGEPEIAALTQPVIRTPAAPALSSWFRAPGRVLPDDVRVD